jgi:hypothetical protein
VVRPSELSEPLLGFRAVTIRHKPLNCDISQSTTPHFTDLLFCVCQMAKADLTLSSTSRWMRPLVFQGFRKTYPAPQFGGVESTGTAGSTQCRASQPARSIVPRLVWFPSQLQGKLAPAHAYRWHRDHPAAFSGIGSH